MAAESLRHIGQSPRLRTLFPALFLLFTGWMLATTYVPLIVPTSYQGARLGFTVGLVVGAGGLLTLVLAPLLGTLGDRYGCWRVLISAAPLSVFLRPLPASMPTLVSFDLAWAILNGLTAEGFALSFTVLADAIVPAMRGRIMCFAYLPLLFANILGPGWGTLIAQQTLFATFPVAAVLTALGVGAGRRCKSEAAFTLRLRVWYNGFRRDQPTGKRVEKEQKSMLSELRTRKFTALFACFDFDKNDVLEKADYEHFAHNLSQAYNLRPGSTHYAAMYAETMALWEFVHNVADKDGDHRVSVAEFIAAYAAMTNDDATFQQLLMSYAEYVIRTGDRNGDGRLDEDEYTTILWCYGIADADARAAFRHLVTDGSGYLTNRAMEQVFAEFFRSDDPDAPGNWMIGPLGSDGN